MWKSAASVCGSFIFMPVCFATLIIIMIVGGIRFVAALAAQSFAVPPPFPAVSDSALRFKELQQRKVNITWEEFKLEVERKRAQQLAYERTRFVRDLIASAAWRTYTAAGLSGSMALCAAGEVL
ncbi:hypothetical protein [Desulfovirgula thermocuniculi]|uniref:hypothetical protein n=1 Tax=Desulfovirgula thermocuniculi TaxID=348842 RepID=UPI00048064B8|nr:hypothetical protein [Desulfovirgula thermocuniculi]